MPAPVETAVILLVDGDAANLKALAGMIGSLGQVVTAATGEEAVNQARVVRPLIVLVNVALPGIDGYETCRRIKDDPKGRDAAVILIYPSRDAIDRARGFEAGAVDFLSAPFVDAEVVGRVQTHLVQERLPAGASGCPGKYGASALVTAIGPMPGPPPPCGMQNVLCRFK